MLPAPSPNQHQARKVSSAENEFEACSSPMKEASLRQLLSDSDCTAQGLQLAILALHCACPAMAPVMHEEAGIEIIDCTLIALHAQSDE